MCCGVGRAVVMVLTEPSLRPAGLHKEHCPSLQPLIGGPSKKPFRLWKQIIRPIDQRHKNNMETGFYFFPFSFFPPTPFYIFMLGLDARTPQRVLSPDKRDLLNKREREVKRLGGVF